MKIIKDWCIFSTGTELQTNCGVIGIGPDLKISGGWYQGLYQSSIWLGGNYKLTRAERIELADYMINQWGKFKKEAEK